MNDILQTKITYLPGVGPKRAELLQKELGLVTFEDMVMHLPKRYIDRSRIFRISDITDDSMPYIQIKARVVAIQYIGQGRTGRLVVEVYDGSAVAEMVWFAGINWVQKHIERDREYIFFGKPAIFNGHVSVVHPEFELPNDPEGVMAMGVQGVYSTTEKLRTAMVGSRAQYHLMHALWSRIAGHIPETLPEYLIQRLSLTSRAEALYNAHFPPTTEALQQALFRLKFEELFTIQLSMLSQKKIRTEQSMGYIFRSVGQKFNTFYNKYLTFPLTQAQKRVVREIRADMGSGHQMNRLLQGDVGSGKTIVALLCALIAVDNGFQASIMAPTEILARQHFESLSELCAPLGVSVELLTGSTRKKQRTLISQGLLSGQIDILIGTHALIEDSVQYAHLGFVVIDEQHRFGVMQRAKLWTKSELSPHILVMTATPIPRTLAMTLYGDLDISVIDELPPGRKPIQTMLFRESERLRVVGFMREQIAMGRQIYVVYPLIKESEKMDYASLEHGVQAIVEHFPHPTYSNVVVHGKMKNDEKGYGMGLFSKGEAQILVSTTVIEVGVNVPNATVMVIESAERFGLSQLHQLRGRVGRGADQSFCILMCGDKLSRPSRARLEAMVSTTDGFALAEMDLELRGAGDIEGTRQSGQAVELRVADLARDTKIIAQARQQAINILEVDPELHHPLNAPLRALITKPVVQNEIIDVSKIS
ncbi:MAG: ATP-dependent DNA helicase RecG [Mucinivorans sp.]